MALAWEVALILALDGVEAQIIADDTESGLSLEQATYSVNLWRAEQDPVLEHVGISAVASCYHALEPVVSQIVDLKQGLDDPDSFWARARRNWAIQMSLLLELITEEELDMVLDRSGEIKTGKGIMHVEKTTSAFDSLARSQAGGSS